MRRGWIAGTLMQTGESYHQEIILELYKADDLESILEDFQEEQLTLVKQLSPGRPYYLCEITVVTGKEEALLERAFARWSRHPKIEILWSHVVTEAKGKDFLEAVREGEHRGSVVDPAEGGPGVGHGILRRDCGVAPGRLTWTRSDTSSVQSASSEPENSPAV